MSDNDKVAPITTCSRRTIIPSSRLVDSNNSVTPELTSHKYIQQTVQPVGTAASTKTCPKHSAMDADWSLTLDIKDLDGNGKQMKVKHLWQSRESCLVDVSIFPDATDTIDGVSSRGNITPVDDDNLLQDINVQDVSQATTVRWEDKSCDIAAFFGKSYAHKSKDGKTRNVQDCDPCKKVDAHTSSSMTPRHVVVISPTYMRYVVLP
ncbi:hypothetical protein BDR03DRAFT_1015861 [Suillus americanus]|nr:hypothetical protein BDR03DRAFT_1015861 [Suillus americanus]